MGHPSRRTILFSLVSLPFCIRSGSANYIEPVSVAEQLLYATVRIVGKNAAGQDAGGTGFFYAVDLGNNKFTVLLITNQHVVRDLVGGVDIVVHTRSAPAGKPDGKSTVHLLGTLGNEWVVHPNGVDLCAYAISLTLNSLNPPPFISHISRELIPSEAILNELDAIEDVVMVGYPALLSDVLNDYPIIRRGITASDPAVDFNGRPEIAIDISAIGGSSGSPVFIYSSSGTHLSKHGGTVVGGPRVIFLGILYQAVELNTQGQIQITEAPTLLPGSSNVYTGIFAYHTPINVGMIIKSKEVEPLADAVLQRIGLKAN